MKLPSLKFSLPFIFLCWCVAGVLTHGSIILAYPAMWAVVGLLFYGLHLVTKSPASAEVGATTAADNQSQRLTSADESPTDHHISAPV
ncbi:MAG: hypothetical protein AAGD11_16840 [Planctomycetota bacterium]